MTWWLDTPRLTDSTTLLRPGDVVVLYTDGVVEARRDRELLDDERLGAAVPGTAGTAGAQQIADSVVATARDFQHGHAKDDIAVVVIEVPAGGDERGAGGEDS